MDNSASARIPHTHQVTLGLRRGQPDRLMPPADIESGPEAINGNDVEPSSQVQERSPTLGDARHALGIKTFIRSAPFQLPMPQPEGSLQVANQAVAALLPSLLRRPDLAQVSAQACLFGGSLRGRYGGRRVAGRRR